jgi:predicted O-methyltransferase YrrM
VLDRLEREAAGDASRTTGQFLFALVAPQWDCEVLEVGAGPGYASLWLGAGVRYLGGHLTSLEGDAGKIQAWRANIAEAGLEEWAALIEEDAADTIPAIDDVFDIVLLDGGDAAYEQHLRAAREKVEPGALIVTNGPRVEASDPTLETVRVPIDRGLELSVVLTGDPILDG